MLSDERWHIFLMAMRQVLIMALGALEDLLELERSIVPRRKRHESQAEYEVR
jgi:hypothetical protein